MTKKIFSCFIILTVFLFSSCTKDDDRNNTTNDNRDSFTGTWVCNEESQVFGNNTYSVDINPHSSINNQIIVDNFYNLGFQISHAQMEISGTNVDIFLQNINGFEITGSGILVNPNQINLVYTIHDSSAPDHVSAVYVKTN